MYWNLRTYAASISTLFSLNQLIESRCSIDFPWFPHQNPMVDAQITWNPCHSSKNIPFWFPKNSHWMLTIPSDLQRRRVRRSSVPGSWSSWRTRSAGNPPWWCSGAWPRRMRCRKNQGLPSGEHRKNDGKYEDNLWVLWKISPTMSRENNYIQVSMGHVQ